MLCEIYALIFNPIVIFPQYSVGLYFLKTAAIFPTVQDCTGRKIIEQPNSMVLQVGNHKTAQVRSSESRSLRGGSRGPGSVVVIQLVSCGST